MPGRYFILYQCFSTKCPFARVNQSYFTHKSFLNQQMRCSAQRDDHKTRVASAAISMIIAPGYIAAHSQLQTSHRSLHLPISGFLRSPKSLTFSDVYVRWAGTHPKKGAMIHSMKKRKYFRLSFNY